MYIFIGKAHLIIMWLNIINNGLYLASVFHGLARVRLTPDY